MEGIHTRSVVFFECAAIALPSPSQSISLSSARLSNNSISLRKCACSGSANPSISLLTSTPSNSLPSSFTAVTYTSNASRPFRNASCSAWFLGNTPLFAALHCASSKGKYTVSSAWWCECSTRDQASQKVAKSCASVPVAGIWAAWL